MRWVWAASGDTHRASGSGTGGAQPGGQTLVSNTLHSISRPGYGMGFSKTGHCCVYPASNHVLKSLKLVSASYGHRYNIGLNRIEVCFSRVEDLLWGKEPGGEQLTGRSAKPQEHSVFHTPPHQRKRVPSGLQNGCQPSSITSALQGAPLSPLRRSTEAGLGLPWICFLWQLHCHLSSQTGSRSSRGRSDTSTSTLHQRVVAMRGPCRSGFSPTVGADESLHCRVGSCSSLR